MMLVPFAIASALAAPAGDAPPVAPPAPQVAPAPAPAPAPATTTTVVVAPAPAPAGEAQPTTTVVVTTGPASSTPPPAPAPIEPVPAPTLVVQPVLSPPAPTWGPVRKSAPLPPDPIRTEQTVRAFRRGAIGLLGIGSIGMGAALGLQYARATSIRRCLGTNDRNSHACQEVNPAEMALGRYSAMGMVVFVVGTTGAGTLLGNAAATRDVQLRGRDARRRGGAKLVGALAVGAASVWLIGANYRLARLESQCGDDYGCIAKYRPLRWAANDGAALGIGAGAGLIGWATAYERQGKALVKLRASPSVSARHTGLALSGAF